jgi:hypothetical protein
VATAVTFGRPLLIAQSSIAPAMLLVAVIKGTLAPDGIISNEAMRTYLVCRSRGAAQAV